MPPCSNSSTGSFRPNQLAQHGIGWGHFLDRLTIAAVGGDAGPDPWATEPPA